MNERMNEWKMRKEAVAERCITIATTTAGMKRPSKHKDTSDLLKTKQWTSEASKSLVITEEYSNKHSKHSNRKIILASKMAKWKNVILM